MTVVEDFDPDVLIHGAPREKSSAKLREKTEADPAQASRNAKAKGEASNPAGGTTKGLKAKSKSKTKGKRVKYQTKAERNVEKRKQRARWTEKAERAGGKASRPSKKSGRRR